MPVGPERVVTPEEVVQEGKDRLRCLAETPEVDQQDAWNATIQTVWDLLGLVDTQRKLIEIVAAELNRQREQLENLTDWVHERSAEDE